MIQILYRTLTFSKRPVSVSILSLLLLIASASAETLRVTTWNLHGATSLPSNPILTNALEAAAAALKQLDPDVILLQQVRDWRMCSQLAQSLKPAVYEVLICSAFPETPATGKQNRQTAILSKRKAYFSWSEAWSSTEANKTLSGGFVFATIHAGDHRVALFSVELDGQIFTNDGNKSNTAETCRQHWAQQVQSIRKWVTNQPESAVVAGGLSAGTSQLEIKTLPGKAEQEHLVSAFLSTPLAAERPQAGERILARMTATPDALPGIVLSHFPQTCELDLELAEPPAVSAATTTSATKKLTVDSITDLVKPSSIESNLQLAETDSAESPQVHIQFFWLALTPLSILAIAAGLWMLAKRGNNPQRETHSDFPMSLENGNSANSADAVLITSRSTTGSTSDESSAASLSPPAVQQLQVWQQRALAAEQKAQQAHEVIRAGIVSYLREWLKQKLFRKLIVDRSEMLESQHLATLKALAVDERLSRIEVQLQQQNQAYEQRIERLTQELAVTREESRALIRVQIAQIKSEMEAARVKLLAEAETQGVVIT